MKLNVYKNQKEIEKTLEVEAYDLMYGTVEDILDILDGVSENMSDDDLLKLVTANRGKINDLLLDVFPDATEEDLKRTKVKELIPIFLEIFSFVQNSFATGKN